MNKKGVTLLELVVALAIVGIAATFVVPSIGRTVQRFRLKAGAREVANYLMEARTEAMKNADFTSPVAFRVSFDTSQQTYIRRKYQSGSWADDGTAKSLPANVTVTSLLPSPSGMSSTDSYPRYFRPDGSLVLDMNTVPTDDQFDGQAVTVKIQLQNTVGDHYQVNIYSLTGMTEVTEGWN